ncbi:MAG: putative transrane protein [Herbaspirillum sp.]|nr:putative transrane protein [Herbaspirillum sp.]
MMGNGMNRRRGLAGAFAIAAAIGICGPVCAGVKEDPRDAARVWRIYRNPQFERTWGINILGIRLVSSGWMLQFKYRVIDPEKAKLLLDRQAKPYLTDKTSGAMLAVPAMENIGELRQATSLAAGRDYFIIFGNANKVVQRGNRVNIEIGPFHVDDLVVE